MVVVEWGDVAHGLCVCACQDVRSQLHHSGGAPFPTHGHIVHVATHGHIVHCTCSTQEPTVYIPIEGSQSVVETLNTISLTYHLHVLSSR